MHHLRPAEVFNHCCSSKEAFFAVGLFFYPPTKASLFHEKHFCFIFASMSTVPKQKVALVLASGGARGLAHIGVIEELEKNGFEITSIAGSSMGALVGGIYAAGTLQRFTRWICGLNQADVFDLMDFTLSRQGFIKGDKLFGFFKEAFFGGLRIEDLRIPYTAIAGDLSTRKAVVFTEGLLSDAIRASVAIPSAITPVITEHHVLVDGGVVSPIPVPYVARISGDILVICDVNANIPYEKPDLPPRPTAPPVMSNKQRFFDFIRDNISFFTRESRSDKQPGYLDVLSKTFDIMQDSICELTKASYGAEISIDISRDSASTFEFYRAEELIAAGRLAFHKALKSSTFAPST